ncbi:MAG: carboxypeptidase-like regulatory domain-containing protein, partial [Balneolales bacterium]
MTRLKDYSLFFLLLLVAQQVTAQHTISVHISHEETSEPFEGVRIYLSDDVRMSHLTDEEGYFEINDIPNGSYNYTFFLLGYEVVNRRVDISGGDAEFHITLQEISREFSEFTITEQQEINFSIKRLREVEGTAIYAGKKNEVVLLENMVINTASNNARQIYSHISGLNIYESNDAGLQLNIGGRGLDPNRSSHFNTRQNGYDISADVLGYPESYYTPPAEAL